MAGVDSDPEQTFEIVERDAVPAPSPQPNDSHEERIRSLLKWLQPTDYLSPGSEFMKHLHSYVPGTGGWIHKSPVFRAWAKTGSNSGHDRDGGSCLHVRGVAGSGKSVFSASTVRQLQESGNIVLFFFFRQIVDKNHSAKYLVRDFTAQLLRHCPALVTTLTTISKDHAISGNEGRLVWPALVEALTKGITKNVYCVVDALDEMDDGDFQDMVDRLVELGTAVPSTVRVMMTSRPLPKIEQALSSPGIVRLKLDPAMLFPDVARYVNARMATLDPPLSDDKNELVKQTICERANGLFLQARLIADNLAEGLRDGHITEETLPDSLDRLPRTLQEVYEGMLKEHARRSGVTTEQQAKVLMCVTHASRPLRLIELGSLLSNMLHISLRQGKDLVRQSCGRLLELLEDESVSVIHHSFTEFLHDATRKENAAAFPVLDDIASHEMLSALLLEYLNGCPHFDVTIDDNRDVNYEDYSWANKERASRGDIVTNLRISHPLVSYAAENLTFHLKNASARPLTIAREALSRYLCPGEPAFETWILMNWSNRLSASFTVFHLATAMRTPLAMPLAVVEHFEEKEPTLLDTRDADGRTPLSYAAEHGHDDIAQFLLAKGADAESGGKDGRTPLHWAALKGHSGIVRPLLAAGVDPMIKTLPLRKVYDRYDEYWRHYSKEQAESMRETALTYAFRGDNPQVVQAFMPFVPPAEMNKFFHQANDVKNIETILSTGKVDIDCFRDGKTRLYRAAKAHDPDMIRLLLKHGADPNKRCTRNRFYNDKITLQADTERGPTPLHGFSSPDDRRIFMSEGAKKAEECVRALIEAGADVNARMDPEYSFCGKNLTPLHLAVQKTGATIGYWGSLDKSEEIAAKALLAAGADPNARTDTGDTALHIANPETPGVLDVLVEYGADIDAMNNKGRTPLLEIVVKMAFWSRHDNLKPDVRTFQKLLDLGADVHTTDKNGENFFHHIMQSIEFFSKKEFSPFIRHLLDSRVDLNRRNLAGHPPLWKYNERKYALPPLTDSDEEILRMLIEAGMDINECDGEKGETILWVLLSRFKQNLDVVRMFIRLGADPSVSAKDGGTLLHAAAKDMKKAEWFRYLISVGAKPKVPGAGGDTLIHMVLRSADQGIQLPEILQVLIEAGVAPLAKNGNGQTALHVVKMENVLEYVLKSPIFKGLNINEQDVNGLTPLHNAVALGETAIANLLRAGADPTILAAGDLSLLHLASRTGESCVVSLLLAEYKRRGVLEQYVNLLGEDRAPLHYACRFRRPETVWELLRNGADPLLLDRKGLMPLHAMAEFEPLGDRHWHKTHTADIVVMLHQAGVDLSVEAVVEEEDGRTRTVTPLDLAVEKKCWDMVRALVTRGVKARDNYIDSPEFILATDKHKAAEKARTISTTLPDKHHGGMWRGRWATPHEADPPLSEEKLYIAGGQTILDIEAGGEVGTTVLDLLKRALHDGDYDSIKEYALMGGDVLRLGESKDDVSMDEGFEDDVSMDEGSEDEGSEDEGSEYAASVDGGYTKDTLLHFLVEGGYVDLLEYFADEVTVFEGQDWVQTDEKSCATLLGTACNRSLPSLNIIQMLVDKMGVDVNAVYNRYGYSYKLRGATALHILASGSQFWQIEALEYLLSKGANIEALNKDGMTPLLAALSHADPDGYWREETVRVLLKHGANVNAITAREEDSYGRSIPKLSALEMSDQAGITRLLLENGADAKCVPGLIARMVAKESDVEVIKVLLEAGLDPNELPVPWTEREGNNHEPGIVRYALHEACRPSTKDHPLPDSHSRKQATIELLLLHGADPSALYPDGRSLLQCIVEDQGEIEYLLPRLSQKDINCKGQNGRTILISACVSYVPPEPQYKYRGWKVPTPSIVTGSILSLLKHGADVLAVDDEGRTALHWVSALPGKYDEQQRQALIALVEHGPAAINIADKQGRKPLHLALAAYAGSLQESLFAIEHLISAGSNINEPDPITGNSTLHQLALRLVGHAGRAAEATALFRQFSASLDINARNDLGETPVMVFLGAGWEGTRDPTRAVSHPRYAIAHDVTHATALDVFIDLGADLMAVDARGQTLLHATAMRELPDVSSNWDQSEDLEGAFKKLMELGVDPRREDAELRTAIDIAVARKLRGVIKLFEEKRVEKAEEGDGEGSDIEDWGL